MFELALRSVRQYATLAQAVCDLVDAVQVFGMFNWGASPNFQLTVHDIHGNGFCTHATESRRDRVGAVDPICYVRSGIGRVVRHIEVCTREANQIAHPSHDPGMARDELS